MFHKNKMFNFALSPKAMKDKILESEMKIEFLKHVVLTTFELKDCILSVTCSDKRLSHENIIQQGAKAGIGLVFLDTSRRLIGSTRRRR